MKRHSMLVGYILWLLLIGNALFVLGHMVLALFYDKVIIYEMNMPLLIFEIIFCGSTIGFSIWYTFHSLKHKRQVWD